MFKENIVSNEFVSSQADRFVGRIYGNNYQTGDVSFVSTLRALLFTRVPATDSIRLRYTHSSFAKETNGASPRICVRTVCRANAIGGINSIDIHNFNSFDREANDDWLHKMEEGFLEEFHGWVRVQKVTEFYRKSFGVVCFICEESKSVVIFTSGMDLRRWHYLQCSCLAFLPWYFNPKDGVSELEMELINSLRKTDHTVYLDCIKRIAAQCDFREKFIKDSLKGFESTIHTREISRLKNDIQAFNRSIRLLSNDIRSKIAEVKNKQACLLGLEESVRRCNDASEVMEYFLSNKNLILRGVEGEEIIFVAKGFFEYFDEDLAESAISNRDSYVYYDGDYNRVSDEEGNDMKKLMTAIFVDRTLKIRVCAAYRMSMEDGVRGIERYGDYGSECDDSMSNPHTDSYSCMGDYEGEVNDCLDRGDYIGAIEQCIASCQSLNFCDSTVMEEFMSRMYGTSRRCGNRRCIVLPDDSVVTPEEAIEWIKNEENGTGGNNEQSN